MAKTKKKVLKIKQAFTQEELEYILCSSGIEEDKRVFMPMFAMTLASYPTFYKKIDELYEKKPFEHHIAFKQSSFKHYYRFESLSLQEEFYAKRILALFEYDLKQKEGYNTYQLYLLVKSKFFKQAKKLEQAKVFNMSLLAYELYVLEGEMNTNSTQYTKISMVEDVRTFFSKKHSMYSFLLDDRLRYEFTMLFLAKVLQKKIELTSTEAYKKAVISTMNEVDITESYMTAMLDKKEKEEEDFYKTVKQMSGKVNVEDNEMTTFDEAFGYKNIEILKEVDIESYSLFSLIRYVEVMENYVLPTVKLPLNKKEAEREISQILASSPYSTDQVLENYYYVYLGLFLKRIIQKFKETKEFFNKKETNEQNLELKTLKIDLESEKEKNKLLEEKIKELEKIINDNKKKEQTEWNTIYQENKKLLTKKENLETQLESQNEELHYLREYSYSLEQEFQNSVIEKTVYNIEDFLDQLNQRKIIVVGGHPNWKSKLKERIPSIIFMDKDTRFDANLLQTADFVYYQTNNLSHGMFYRVHPIIKKENVPYGFLPTGNIDITILQMQHEWVKKNKDNENL